jgi:hypothetical protein
MADMMELLFMVRINILLFKFIGELVTFAILHYTPKYTPRQKCSFYFYFFYGIGIP